MIPRSSADYYRRQQLVVTRLLLAVRRSWRRMDPKARWSEQYADDGIGRQLLMLVTAAQVAAARDADQYIADVLAELGLVNAARPGIIRPAGYSGATGDGRPVESLLALTVPMAGQAFNAHRREEVATTPTERPEGMSDVAFESLVSERQASAASRTAFDLEQAAALALGEVETWLAGIAASIVFDTARAAESAASAAYPAAGGYVRMLNPPSCSRCAILAGRFYRWNEGFQRHPLCDCRHVPSSEAIAGDMTVNPDAYFHSLSTAEQNRIFTKSGAQAIRDGADMNQVVNARRGMRQAQVYGHDVIVTSEGTTRRGLAYRALGGDRSNDRRAAGERYFRTNQVRLMPESIYEIADGDRDEAIRLLRLHGFIT